MKNNYLEPFFLLFLVFVLCFSCAHVEAPTGGPKDVKPPVVLECEPPNYSTNFSADKIVIHFDEFVNLVNANQQVIISPSFKEMPEFILRKKNLLIRFQEKPKENTTYNIFMGDAIADVNENNVLRNYHYVFSTGSYLDSMIIKGNVVDAYTLKPDKDMFVMLYDKYADTLPFKTRPTYLTKTDDKGNFILYNLKPNKYKIFALKDMNSNFLYDQISEQIAYLDTLINSEINYVQDIKILSKNDSIKLDSLRKIKSIDTINLIPRYIEKNTIHHLFFYKEQDSILKLINAKTLEKGCFQLILNSPAKNILLTPLNFNPSKDWIIEDKNKTNDTIKYWLPDFAPDSLIAEVSVGSKVLDTIRLNMKNVFSSNKNEIKMNKFFYKLNVKNKENLGYFKDFVLTSTRPVASYDFSKITMTIKKDTSIIKIINPEVFVLDSLKKTFAIKYKWNDDYSYKLFIPPSTFKDVFGFANDTIQVAFKISPAESYGNIKMKVNLPDVINSPLLLLMTDDKGTVLQSVILPQNHIAELKNITPGNYCFKLVFDVNGNGKWDEGNYLKKIQPEKIVNYPELMNVRANWDSDLEWKIEIK